MTDRPTNGKFWPDESPATRDAFLREIAQREEAARIEALVQQGLAIAKRIYARKKAERDN